MLEAPFDIIHCSWPRPVEQQDRHWTSAPEWDAPAMPCLPELRVEVIDDHVCWQIDWRESFKRGVKWWAHNMGGEMRGFHLVFHLRLRQSGRLIFWDDDGCIIRRRGEILHADPSAHALTRHEINVQAGDVLEVAQWQFGWGWLWAARLSLGEQDHQAQPTALLQPYLAHVLGRLSQPNGPPLKLYTNGQTPLRAIVSLYSLVLNGYTPTQVYLFGEEQWPDRTRSLFANLLPFARVIPVNQVISHLNTLQAARLSSLARQFWFVMKMCIALLYPPDECCVIDDDVFILDRLDEALELFRKNDLVYTPDQDLGAGYLSTWGWMNGAASPLRTARFNAGLYWIRRVDEARWLAAQSLRARPNPHAPYLWEQGFIAMAYAHRQTAGLPSQQYLFPLFDGLPGGLLGYDYQRNPCGFTSIHFGGLAEKPSDGAALQLMSQLLHPHSTPSEIQHADPAL